MEEAGVSEKEGIRGVKRGWERFERMKGMVECGGAGGAQ
jgi:hypothetical protein